MRLRPNLRRNNLAGHDAERVHKIELREIPFQFGLLIGQHELFAAQRRNARPNAAIADGDQQQRHNHQSAAPQLESTTSIIGRIWQWGAWCEGHEGHEGHGYLRRWYILHRKCEYYHANPTACIHKVYMSYGFSVANVTVSNYGTKYRTELAEKVEDMVESGGRAFTKIQRILQVQRNHS